MNRRARYCLFVVFLALLLNVVLAVWRVRVDCTSERRFTLSAETNRVLSALERPVQVDVYRSRSVSGIPPSLQSHGKYVEAVLKEYARSSHGKLQVLCHDPAVGTEAEEQAMKAGMVFEELRPGDAASRFCLGTCFRSLGRRDVSLRQITPRAVNTLEYELTRALGTFLVTDKTRVGVLSSLPLFGGIDLHTRQQRPEWELIHTLRDNHYEVVDLGGSLDSLAAGIDILLMVHPPELDLDTLRKVDRFMLDGGRLLAFLDPGCWTAMMFKGDPTVSASNLPGMLKAWGVTFHPAQTVLDAELATIVLNRNSVPENHLEWLSLKRPQMSETDAVTSQLALVEVFHAGHFTWQTRPDITVTPLLKSSERAQLVDAQLAFRPQTLMERDYQAGGKELCLGLSIEGKLPSAFGTEVRAGGRAILIGDADGLHDSFASGRKTDNLQLVLNCLDRLRREGEELLALRNRCYASRRLEKLHDRLQQDSKDFQKELDGFQEERLNLERDIRQLEARRQEGILTDVQGDELRSKYERVLQADRRLRRIQAASSRERESYRQRIVLLNILLGPILLVFILLGGPFWNLWRRDWHRGLRLTVAILVVCFLLLGLCFWSRSCGRGEAPRKTVLLLDRRISRDALRNINIVKGSGTLHLDRQANGIWTVRERFGYPANAQYINEVTGSVNLARGVQVTVPEADLKLLQLTPDKACRVTFMETKVKTDLAFGSYQRNYNNEPAGRYVQDKNGKILLCEQNLQLVDASPEQWLDHHLPGFGKETKRISRVAAFKELRWCLERREGGYEVMGRMPARQAVRASVVKNIIDNFRYLRVQDVCRQVEEFKQLFRLHVVGEDDILYEYVFGKNTAGRWFCKLERAVGVGQEKTCRMLMEHYGTFYLEINGRLANAFMRKRLDFYGYRK